MSRIFTGAIMALAVAAGAAAQAQPADSSPTTAPATAPTATGPAQVTLPTVPITGQGLTPVQNATPTTLAPSPGQTVSTVERATFTDQPNKSIADVLLQTPGVSVQQGNGPRDISVSVRGSNVRQTYGIRNLQVFEDGFPVTQPDGLSRTDLTDPNAYSSIDVVRGPSSALYGNYATGGALFFNTVPGHQVQGLDMGIDSGSFGYVNAYGTLGFAGDNYDASLFGSHVSGNGFIEHSRYQTNTANLLASYDLGPDDRLTLKIIHNSLDTEVPIRLSLVQFGLNPFQKGCSVPGLASGCGTISVYANGMNGTKVLQTASQAGLGRTDERNIVGVQWTHAFDNDTSFRTLALFDDRNINQPTGATTAVGPYPSFAIMTEANQRGSIAGLSSLTTLGFSVNDEFINSYTYNIKPGGSTGLVTQTTFGNQLNVGVRAASQVDLADKWKSLLALGWGLGQIDATQTVYGYPTTGGTTLTNIPALRTYSNVAPSASLIFEPTKEWSFYTRASTGFGTPAYSNLFVTPQGTFGNNTQLKPQTNVGFDLGATYTLGSAIRLEAVGFYEFFHNELVTQSAGASLQSYTYNAPASQHRGIEVGATVKPLPANLPGATFRFAWIYDNQIYTSYVETLSTTNTATSFNRSGNAIPGVPSNQLWARLDYTQPEGTLKGLGAYAETIFRGASWMDNANLVQVPAYAIMNLAITYDPGLQVGPFSAVRLYLQLQNVLNKTYVASASNVTDTINALGQQNGATAVAATTGSIYAGSPRAVYGGLKMHF